MLLEISTFELIQYGVCAVSILTCLIATFIHVRRQQRMKRVLLKDLELHQEKVDRAFSSAHLVKGHEIDVMTGKVVA